MKCVACGCTDFDCRGCISRTGEACHWVEDGICSACTGSKLIALERARGIDEEGFDAAHDDEHVAGELHSAAFCYWTHPKLRDMSRVTLKGCCAEGRRVWIPKSWPFEPTWWRPARSRVRDLVKAGALFLAERDRLDRLGKKKSADRMGQRARGCAIAIDRIHRNRIHLNKSRQILAGLRRKTK